MPNGVKFCLLQGRVAFFCFFNKALVGSFAVAVLFDDTTGKSGHCGVAAAFGNNLITAVRPAVHICIKVLAGQIFGEGHLAGIQFNFRVCRTEKEPGGIQSFGIEVWEDGVDQLFHLAVCRSIGHIFNGKQHMELGPRGFAVFLPHMGTTVMNRKGNAEKSQLDIFRRDPVLWVLGVVIVAVYGQAV